MLIGELSKLTGMSRDTIRYYEKLLLIAVRKNCSGNHYKNYGPEVVERLRQIQQLKDIGFTLREVHQLLTVDNDKHPCKDLPFQLDQKLEKIDTQLAILQKFKSALMAMKSACGGNCNTQDGMPACVPEAGFTVQTSRCC